MTPAPKPVGTTVFLAAGFGDALGISPRAVRRILASVPPSGYQEVRGQSTPGWTLPVVPAAFRRRLEEKAAENGFGGAFDLLVNCAGQWQPEVPLTDLEPAAIEKASRLRVVLAPVLRLDGGAASISDLTRAAQTAFARHAGYELKDDRSVRRWIERAQRRDRGRGEWERIELYLDDRLARRAPVNPARRTLLGEASILQEALNLLPTPATATLEDRNHIWRAAVEEIERRIEVGQPGHQARGEVADVLAKCGVPLAATRAGLDKSLRRKHRRWQASDGRADVLKDQRSHASGNRRKPDLGEAQNLLLARTLACGGRVSQAYRELWDEGRLPASFYQSYTRDAADKSRVPKQIRDLFPSDFVAEMKKHHIGPKEVKLRGPKCSRDWSQMPSGVEAQSDDMTPPVFFWIQLPDGTFKLLQGQFLAWVDTRSTYIYCFQLLPTESYSSLDIVRGVVQLHDNYGLPEQLYFERGIWEKSLLIAGRNDQVSWKHRVYGLRDLGITLTNSHDPSGKVIERVYDSLQNQMERERGYCGREQRKDCPEAVKKAKRLVEAGRCHPGEFFYSYAEWVERLNHICNAYNDDPRNGKMNEGMTPREAFVKLQAEPPIRLDETTRYLLASHRREEKVSARGLTIKIGNVPYTYKSEETGRLIGQKVLAWFDLEDPSFITVTTLDGKNPVTVARETLIPAYRAPKEIIGQAKRENAAHMAPCRQLYSTLRKDYPEEVAGMIPRQMDVPEETRALGAEMNRQKTARKTRDAQVQRSRRATQEKSRRAGYALPPTDDPRALAAQARLAALMQKADETSHAENP